jgi:transposase
MPPSRPTAPVGTGARRAAQHPRDGAGHQAAGLDAQHTTLGATERDEQQRQAYRERVAERDGHAFVVVDECGATMNLPPRYARAPHGQRAYGHVPRTTKQTTTLIASLRTAGMGAAMRLPGATATAACEAYGKQVLAPTLVPGKSVVMDTRSAPTSGRVRSLIEARGCELWFLPAYSPDLSPIEEAFSKFKAWQRRLAARTQETLEQALAAGLDLITPQDALGYFHHCGYRSRTLEAQ